MTLRPLPPEGDAAAAAGGPRSDSRGGADDLLPVATLRTPAETAVVAALLRAAGLQPWVGGQMLMDEFAISQARMGLAQTTISVPRSQHRTALEVIEEGRREGRAGRDED